MKPFRFYASASGALAAGRVVEVARKAESIGYTGIVLPDHLVDQPAPIAFLTAVAAATTRLRVGTFVLNNDLRHPAVLGQELATLDVLSGGRLDIGIGAGWNRPEYDRIGIAFEPTRRRVERLAESIAVLKGLFGDGPLTFAGTHYRITSHDGRPKPVQKPHPPFLVGGGGRRILELAAREAQIVGFAPRIGAPDGVRSGLWDGTAEKVAWVRAAAGARFGELDLNTYPSFGRPTVTDDAGGQARALAARLRERWGVELGTEELLRSPHVFIGSIADLTEKFRSLRSELGINSIMVGDVDSLAPVVERLAGT